MIKVPKVKLKKFRKFKSDSLWEKENANYESLDSEDSMDIQAKVNKSPFKRAPDMDRMDLTESNIKKKKLIQKELSKTYMKVETYGTNQRHFQSNSSGQNVLGAKDIKINLFEDSQVYRIDSVKFKKCPKKKEPKNKSPVKYELKESPSMQTSAQFEKDEFLPKVLSRRRSRSKSREAQSMDRKTKEENREKNLNTRNNMMDIKKRFETESEFEEFKFY